MTNTEKLKDAIAERGVKQKYLADKCGITEQSFSSKILGSRDFTLTEAGAIREALHLSDEEFLGIFFGNNVA